MYQKNRIQTAKDIIKFFVIFIFLTVVVPMLFALVFGGINSSLNPTKCVTDYDGQRFCKSGNNEWKPR